MIGETFGGFTVTAAIGSGGMGTVYLAENPRIGRKVAVKVLLPEHSSNAEVVNRFFDEAKAAASIAHPGIVQILDCGVHAESQAFIVMELLEGESLRGALDRTGGLADDLPLLVHVGASVANAMSAAHARGIVHRDLKPDNIFLQRAAAGGKPVVKVLDFGIAKLQRGPNDTQKTQVGTVLGTPVYMSPEQCRGSANLAPSSDIYSLGCVLFEVAVGRPPFLGTSAAELMAAHLGQSPPALRTISPRVPAALDDLIAQMLAKDPAARPSRMEDVESALRALPTGAVRASATLALDANTAMPVQRPSASVSGTKVLLDPTSGAVATRTRPRAPAKRSVIPIVASAAGLAVASALGWLLLRRSAEPAADASPADASRLGVSAHARPAPAGMVAVPGGRFAMGSAPDQTAAALAWCATTGASCRRDIYEREQPVRPLTVGAFWLDATEVTNADFAAWLAAHAGPPRDGRIVTDRAGVPLADLHPAHSGVEFQNGAYRVRSGFARKPVAQVSWHGARAFCEAQGKRLPTEAEWELAARGTLGREFPSGSAPPTCQDAAFGRGSKGACSGQGPDDVGAHAADATPEGVRDLGGNVSEWVADVFVAPYPACPAPCLDPIHQPTDAPPEAPRVIRGGDWLQPVDATRAAGRSRREPSKMQINVGFRCAKTPVPENTP